MFSHCLFDICSNVVPTILTFYQECLSKQTHTHQTIYIYINTMYDKLLNAESEMYGDTLR